MPINHELLISNKLSKDNKNTYKVLWQAIFELSLIKLLVQKQIKQDINTYQKEFFLFSFFFFFFFWVGWGCIPKKLTKYERSWELGSSFIHPFTRGRRMLHSNIPKQIKGRGRLHRYYSQKRYFVKLILKACPSQRSFSKQRCILTHPSECFKFSAFMACGSWIQTLLERNSERIFVAYGVHMSSGRGEEM